MKITLLFLFLILLKPVFFMGGSINYEKEVTSLVPHLYEAFILMIFIIIYTVKYQFRLYYDRSFLYFYFLYFYIISLLSTVWSMYPIMTVFYSLKGIAYIVLAGFMLKEISDKPHYTIKLFKFTIFMCIVSALVNAIGTLPFSTYSVKGLQSGYLTLLALSLYIYSRQYATKNMNYSFKFSEVPLYYLGSISSILAINLSRLTLAFIQKSFFSKIKVLIVLTIFISILFLFISNEKGFLGKDLSGLKSGSGRFDVWLFLIIQWINDSVFIFGNGMFSDIVYLERFKAQIPWAHTAHNSLLSLYLGLGLIGLLFYFVLTIHVIKEIFKKQNSLFLLLALYLYGLTSNIFPGSPSLLIVFSIIITSSKLGKKSDV